MCVFVCNKYLTSFNSFPNFSCLTLFPSFRKHIPLKDISLVTREPLKETKNILEDENDKQILMSTGGPTKKNYIPRDKKGNQLCTYADVVYTGKLSN